MVTSDTQLTKDEQFERSGAAIAASRPDLLAHVSTAQQKVLGLVAADDAAKASAAKRALIASRTNVLLSIPMLLCMTNYR